ncbi:hypothetical protein Agub_g12975 [Astrephomene gubernaculifera]|uniref:Endonuclease/exonuclease/phosphatase domain-containing protein n=1 Tax=Astrephomene gubernaculifera TaxID=47775 RepID=A0AAD3HRR4_9CHLO|nr:hypothetical protein Agub_g12975 [Astrephomene gubernaculifera]
MTEPIDLTDDGSDATVIASKSGDEGTKRKLAALCEGLSDTLRVADAPARKRLRTAVDGVEFPVPAPKNDLPQGRGTAVGASESSKPAAPQTLAPAAAAAQAAAPQAAPSAAPPVDNNFLAQLHAERLSRMTEASKAALRSPCKAEAPKSDQPSHPSHPRQPFPTADASTAASRVGAASTSEQRAAGAPSAASSPARTLSVLTYNLWFNEEVELVARMRAVGDIIEREGFPDLLLFQEVTQNIALLFRQSAWFRRYHCSPVPDQPYFTLLLARRDTATLPAMQPWMNKDFSNSLMGRGILYTRVAVGGRPLVVGTTHLESPVGQGQQQMVPQRQEQMGIAIRELEAAAGPAGDVLLAGDMNWTDHRDGAVPLPPGWCDAWQVLMPNQPGLTWNPACNPMLTSRFKGSRLDRVLCRLSGGAGGGSASSSTSAGGRGGGGSGWRLGEIKLVGTQALPGVTYEAKGKRLPVLPSDHFGLLVKLLPADATPAAAASGHVLGAAAQAPSSAATAVAMERGRGGSAAGTARGPSGGAAPAAANGSSNAARESAAVRNSQQRPQTQQNPPLRRLPAAQQQQQGPAPSGSRAARKVTEVDLSTEDADDDVIVL